MCLRLRWAHPDREEIPFLACLGAHFADSASVDGVPVMMNARINGVPGPARARHNRGHGIVALAAG